MEKQEENHILDRQQFGAVVLNRVKSSSFPNTIAGVIYEKGAFSVVDDGQINLTPNNTAKQAAQDALNGWDPTGGAIYYFNPNTATNSWIWSRPLIKTIGKHRFCKQKRVITNDNIYLFLLYKKTDFPYKVKI